MDGAVRVLALAAKAGQCSEPGARYLPVGSTDSLPAYVVCKMAKNQMRWRRSFIDRAIRVQSGPAR